jgi:ABA responsive element binding factor
MGSQSLSPQQTQARPSSMGTNPSNPSSGSNNGGLASSTLPGGGLGRYNSLARQSSIYSLTLDEFQNTMTEPGKNFGSMNMDEFLKNIWTAEESQAMAAAMGSITDSAQAGNAGGMLTRQPSLGAMSLPRTLSRKTVDQVWRDIHRDSSGGSDSGGGGLAGAAAGTMPQEREATFGEMTLEDFLVKAGVVREDAEIGSQGFSPFVGASVMTSGDIDRSVQGGSAAGDRGGATGGDIVPTLSLSPANVIPSQASIDAMQMDAYNKSQATTQQQQVHNSPTAVFCMVSFGFLGHFLVKCMCLILEFEAYPSMWR